ncbi:MAG: hypothetical protein Q9227_008067 [Pyrenula ochraceoflavens]
MTANQKHTAKPLEAPLPTPPVSSATRLRQLLSSPSTFLLCPGIYDGFSARIALSVGFDALYMTGAGTSASLLGHADLGLLSLPQMSTHASNLASLSPTTPLIADADTGYGGPIMVSRTVTQYAAAGVAALHLEDQIQTKRCGHLLGKQLVDPPTFISRIRAAVQARHRIGSDIVIIARTDALQSLGYDESLARLRAARDVGADVALLEGIASKAQAAQLIKDLHPMPCLLNMVEHGATPTITAAEAKEIGFKIMIVPFAGLAPAYSAIKEGMERLKRDGVLGSGEEMTPGMLFRVCGLEESLKIDEEAGGGAFGGGVD